MFQLARKHINPATIVALVALVFAVTGGAFAATGGNGNGGGSSSGKASASTGHDTVLAVVAKKKSKSKSGGGASRGPAGPRGATGAIGAAGPAGPTGATGAAGPAGATGAKGETGTGTPGATGKEGPEGKEGSPWTAGGTLPSGKTETGTWALGKVGAFPSGTTEETEVEPISFLIPLPASLGEGHAHFIEEAGDEIDESAGVFVKEKSNVCLGTVEEPKAAPGNLCVYTGQLEGVPEEHENFTIIKSPGDLRGMGAVGAEIFFFEAKERAFGYGSWAVTAE